MSDRILQPARSALLLESSDSFDCEVDRITARIDAIHRSSGRLRNELTLLQRQMRRAQGSVAQGSVAQGSVAQGSVAQGSVAQGSVPAAELPALPASY